MRSTDLEVRLEASVAEFQRAMLEAAAALEGWSVVRSSAAEAMRTYNASVRWLRRRGNRWWRLQRGPRIHPNARRRRKRARRGR